MAQRVSLGLVFLILCSHAGKRLVVSLNGKQLPMQIHVEKMKGQTMARHSFSIAEYLVFLGRMFRLAKAARCFPD